MIELLDRLDETNLEEPPLHLGIGHAVRDDRFDADPDDRPPHALTPRSSLTPVAGRATLSMRSEGSKELV